MRLPEFNELAPIEAEALQRPCLDVDRWVRDLVDGRPYGDLPALLDRAAADPLSEAEVTARLADGNRAYERRFGRVFLVRAAGRTPGEVLDRLQQRQIALLRLAGAVTP